jgi:integrase/recombinase XerD
MEENNILQNYGDYLLSVKGYSQNTIRSYQNDLKLFFNYILIRFGEKKKEDPFDDKALSLISPTLLSKVKLVDIYAFLSYCASELHNGDTTRKRRTAAIRSFYHFEVVVMQEHLEDPTQNLEIPKAKKRDPIYLTLDEALSLLNAVEGKNKERDLAIITLFLNCGLRLSELTNLRVEDIQDETLHIVGKGNKERDIMMNDACIDALNNYLPIRQQQINKIKAKAEDEKDEDNSSKEETHLFLSNRGKGISNRMVETMVNKYIKKAGLDSEKFTVHKLRHTAATLMYKYGNIDIRTLQKVLGHENVSTTEIYTHIEDDDVRNAVYKNPLSNYFKNHVHS